MERVPRWKAVGGFAFALLLLLGLSGCEPRSAPVAAVTPTAPATTPPPTATMPPTPAPSPTATLPPDLYPPPLPLKVLWPATQGCPNPAGLEAAILTVEEALEALHSLRSGDPDQMRRAADPALWPLLSSFPERPGPSREEIQAVRPARESPYADLIANGCGRDTLEKSWAIEVCPGPCAPNTSESLIGHLFLIRRAGHWLVWAAE